MPGQEEKNARPSELTRYQASAKLILLGEHFVVHGSPALAVPFLALTTVITISTVTSVSRDVRGNVPQLIFDLGLGPEDESRARALLAAALARLELAALPGQVSVSSGIPLGLGLGSSAAFAVALVGALARASGRALPLEELNAHAHALEKISHGRPSGIDDTVVTFARPVWFRAGHAPRFLEPPAGLRLVLCASRRPRSTREAVSRVCALKQREPDHFAELLVRAGEVAVLGLAAFEEGDLPRLGAALDQNHALLQSIDVSTPELDRLAAAARRAGALGAKLTGAGCGGCVVALVPDGGETQVSAAMRAAGGVILPGEEAHELRPGEQRDSSG